jgi:hypothetical protein
METRNLSIDQIEIHENPTNLYGFKGDKREQVANIIIRKQNVGNASNDLGFLRKPDGTFEAIISEYDKGKNCGEQFIANLKQNYAFHCIRLQQEMKGRTVNRTRLQNGHQRIEIGGY